MFFSYSFFIERINPPIAGDTQLKSIAGQFGFRRHRSTTHALFVARRIQDIGEQTGDNLIITLLDWEKAFDKVSHE